jgi:hypothetical protein
VNRRQREKRARNLQRYAPDEIDELLGIGDDSQWTVRRFIARLKRQHPHGFIGGRRYLARRRR